MKRHLVPLLAIAAGIGLWAVWVAGARGPATASAAPLLVAESLGAPRGIGSLPGIGSPEVTAELTATTYYTAYLPLVQRTVPLCSGTPVLLNPADGSQLATLVPELFYMRGSLPVSSTVVELADNVGFADPLRYTITGGGLGPHDLKPFDNLQPGTRYYWRVQDLCGASQSPMSAVWSFITGARGVILPAPVLLSPADGAIGLTAPVTLTWKPMVDATGYRAVRCTATSCLLSYRTEASWVTWPASLTAYTWYVAAYNDYAYGSESATWHFMTGNFASLSACAVEPGITVSLEGSGFAERRAR